MKYLLLIFLSMACSASHERKTDYSLPPELADCKIFYISDGSKGLYVVKCPNSDVTTSWTHSCGKNCTKTEYLQVVTR
jgi:hypothetical protein